MPSPLAIRMGKMGLTNQDVGDLLDQIEVLSAALLWLRNHYERPDPAMADRVLARIDAVLAQYPPTSAGAAKVRERFPIG